VCGFDVRAARAAAAEMNTTVALDASEEAQAIREQVQAAAADVAAPSETGVSAETMHDSAPDVQPVATNEIASTPAAPSNQTVAEADVVPERQFAPSPEIQSTSFDLQVTSAKAPGAGSNAASPNETFASMPALEPAEPGQFRETQWFMAAQDPDHVDKIENSVLEDLEAEYKPQENQMDTAVRQKFSLNVEGSAGQSKGSDAGSSGSADGNKKMVLVIAGIVIAGIVAYVIFGN
jgi:hypothetical protein